jgi:hypothetical protein
MEGGLIEGWQNLLHCKQTTSVFFRSIAPPLLKLLLPGVVIAEEVGDQR